MFSPILTGRPDVCRDGRRSLHAFGGLNEGRADPGQAGGFIVLTRGRSRFGGRAGLRRRGGGARPGDPQTPRSPFWKSMASGCGGEFDHHLVWKEGEGIHGVSGGGRRMMRPLPFAFPTVKFSWLPESRRGGFRGPQAHPVRVRRTARSRGRPLPGWPGRSDPGCPRWCARPGSRSR
jgi:hypothetical protein